MARRLWMVDLGPRGFETFLMACVVNKIGTKTLVAFSHHHGRHSALGFEM